VSEDYRSLVQVDRVLHEPARLVIAALLFPLQRADFLFLLRETGLTKGNLSSHLAKLEEAAYVKIEKSFRGKVPLTTVSLTRKGQDAVRAYREQMRRALETMPERRARP
jgi:DNA-binding transcriptional ArsR family regulator